MSFKICTIGCGNHATKVHGPSYKRYVELNPGTVLAACCDLDSTKARSFKEKFGFQAFYTDIDTMLDKERPDAVCLIVKESQIAPLSVKVMDKGYPLMMEKPPGLTRDDLISMINAAERANVPNKVAFNRMHIPVMVKLKQLMNDNIPTETIQNIQYDFYRV